MKRLLHLALFSLFFSGPTLLNAQDNGGSDPAAPSWGIQNISVEVVGAAAGGTNTCNASVNLYFVAVVGGKGEKFLTLHIWEKTKRPTTDYLQEGTAPDPEVLKGALGTVVIKKDSESDNWSILSVTGPGGVAVPFTQDQLVAITPPAELSGLEPFYGNYVYYQVRNLNLSVPAACTDLNTNNFVVDTWGSWNGGERLVSCASTNVPIQECKTTTLPTLSGFINCQTSPRSYSITLNNTGNCRPFFVDYKVYLDVNNNLQIDAGDQLINVNVDKDGDGLYDNVAILVPGQGATTTPLRAVEGLNTQSLLVRAEVTTLGANGKETYTLTPPTNEPFFELIACEESALPVKFKTFNATRNTQNAQQINLTWETAQEQNNKGFHVQRKTDGEWQDVAFVSSAAEGGNSTIALKYNFTDNNNFRGISQYRLLQEDVDGKTSYSDVKTVRGLDALSSLIVYPNPVVNGRASVMFPDVQTTREVLVSDISGRVVKQYRDVAGNSLVVDGLTSGVYTIRVVDKKTSAVQVVKLVVQ